MVSSDHANLAASQNRPRCNAKPRKPLLTQNWYSFASVLGAPAAGRRSTFGQKVLCSATLATFWPKTFFGPIAPSGAPCCLAPVQPSLYYERKGQIGKSGWGKLILRRRRKISLPHPLFPGKSEIFQKIIKIDKINRLVSQFRLLAKLAFSQFRPAGRN